LGASAKADLLLLLKQNDSLAIVDFIPAATSVSKAESLVSNAFQL
jgi:hypothetical protein